MFVCVHGDIKTTLVNHVQRAFDWTEEELRSNMWSTLRLFAVKTGFYRYSSKWYKCGGTPPVGYEYTTVQSDVSSNLDANHSHHVVWSRQSHSVGLFVTNFGFWSTTVLAIPIARLAKCK